MPAPFATRRGALLYLLAWLLLGALAAALIVAAGAARWPNALLLALPATLLYGLGAGFSSYYLCRAYPLADKGAAAIAPMLAVAAAAAGALWCGACFAWNNLLLAAQQDWAGIVFERAVGTALFGAATLLYLMAAAFHYLAIESERARLAERRELESKLVAQQAELRMLRTQIDPHFLFNSLNSISALTASNPAGARAMTLQLADFFRRSLAMDAHVKSTLAAELELVGHFLAIEGIRFGQRLRVAYQVEDAARACLLPPMLLQPLVENALKHGIATLTEGGAVRIVARRAASLLYLEVENDVDPEAGANDAGRARPSDGIGLANVRQRLRAAYGHEAALHATRGAASFRVALSLPAHTMEAPPCA
ncbi:MAG: histidine kinase [Pseudomonadota bacterium]